MIAFPNGKINLGLRVLGKRDDGFHDIETVFYPVAIYDILEIIETDRSSFTSSGISVEGLSINNLCLKAYDLLKDNHPSLPTVAMHLHKNIPVGAGLGGGSADATACLRMLNTIGSLGLSAEQISEYALQLGSDCPFFLMNKPCLASGRGEILREVDIDLSAFSILIVNPGIHINTGWAFSALTSYSSKGGLENVIVNPVTTWKQDLHNDFENLINEKYPETKRLKELMYTRGAIYASLSGTGSTVYGLFKKNNMPDFHLPDSYFAKWV